MASSAGSAQPTRKRCCSSSAVPPMKVCSSRRRRRLSRSSLMLAVIGIIPVIWFALLVAPYLSSGLMGILDGVPEAMNHPFSIRLCGDSVKTVLIFLLSYGMGIGIYISTNKHYRRGEEHGSAKWGNVKKINFL